MERELTLELMIMDFECDPSDVTQEIGIEPTVTWKKGEPMSSRSRTRLHKENAWGLSVTTDDPWDYEEQLNTLLAMIIPRLKEFAEFSNKYYCELCWVIYLDFSMEDARFPNPQINKDQMQILNVIGASISFDVYLFPEK